VDGSSVYTVAGADLYTSSRILHAEQRLIATAGHTNGWAIGPGMVELALLETAANGVQLDAGQVNLVRSMATSGARLQLAIAPAGAGKTTALHTLTRAWTEAGGDVIGLAPSAAAAAQLGDQTGAPTDTLTKLTWAIDHQQALPDWASSIGPQTLVLVDEAGMADTLTLDTAVAFVIERGGSVRLVGDDAQLSAIGAGGVLSDIQSVHGAVRLTELHRFADPTEAAATLALRDGRSEALGFYLDRHRVHVGDPTTMTATVFAAWQADRRQGLDALMLAPTRDQVADLNHRARAGRLRGTTPTREVELPDGNRASVGDTVITRRNDRRLGTSGGDWVKNGDRWTVEQITGGGAVRVRHTRTSRSSTLPASYVSDAVELGYATTIHGAQGVTADTMHGLIAGDASRQQLYTMLTRGRTANHLYLAVVGDGDPHTAPQLETIRPATATDLLEQILARDNTPTSATTLQREQHAHSQRLGAAVGRYLDALQSAAQQLSGPDQATSLHPVPGDHRSELRGPLPWLPSVPANLSTDPRWGSYLNARSALIADLAEGVRLEAARHQPPWATEQSTPLPNQLVADVEVWRAANGVPDGDRRATGPAAADTPARLYQQGLNRRLAAGTAEARADLLHLITTLAPATAHDSYTQTLTTRVAQLTAAGFDGRHLLEAAAAQGPLPDDHPAAALWWRVVDQLPAATTDSRQSAPMPDRRGDGPITRGRLWLQPGRRRAARPPAPVPGPRGATPSRPPER
jgi:hypothetical protein